MQAVHRDQCTGEGAATPKESDNKRGALANGEPTFRRNSSDWLRMLAAPRRLHAAQRENYCPQMRAAGPRREGRVCKARHFLGEHKTSFCFVTF